MKWCNKEVLLLVLFIASISLFAQTNEPIADQNPRYKESLQRYSKLADSLTQNLGTTVQQTYKAYDWYEAKLERRQQRREQRQRVYRYNHWDGYYYPSWWYGQSQWHWWNRSYRRFYW